MILKKITPILIVSALLNGCATNTMSPTDSFNFQNKFVVIGSERISIIEALYRTCNGRKNGLPILPEHGKDACDDLGQIDQIVKAGQKNYESFQAVSQILSPQGRTLPACEDPKINSEDLGIRFVASAACTLAIEGALKP